MTLQIEKSMKTNSKQIILDFIENMELEGCANNFANYLFACDDKQSELEVLEKKFYNELVLNLSHLRVAYTIAYNAEEKIDFKELYINLLKDGTYGFDQEDFSEAVECISYYNNAILFPILKEYMKKAITKVVNEMNMTLEQQKQAEKEKEIVTLTNSLERYKQLMQETEEKLKKYQVQ